MKWLAIALATGATLGTAAASAQVGGDCFMLDSNGRRVELGSICGRGDRRGLEPGVYRVPIVRRLSGIPVIEVSLNGQSVEMMLDTGASGTAISPGYAERAGIEPDGVAYVNTPSDTNVPLATGRVRSIEAGGIAARDVVVLIAPSLQLGLLGQDFYAGYDVAIAERYVEFRRR